MDRVGAGACGVYVRRVGTRAVGRSACDGSPGAHRLPEAGRCPASPKPYADAVCFPGWEGCAFAPIKCRIAGTVLWNAQEGRASYHHKPSQDQCPPAVLRQIIEEESPSVRSG